MLGTHSRKQSRGKSLSIISLHLFLINQDKALVMLVDGEKDEPCLRTPTTTDTRLPASVQWKTTKAPSQVSPGANNNITCGGQSLLFQVYIVEDMGQILLSFYEVFLQGARSLPIYQGSASAARCPWAFGPISFIRQNSPENPDNVMGTSNVLCNCRNSSTLIDNS